jgi:uncharacterized protein (TIGR01777 family)
MKIGITGVTGFIGRALAAKAKENGHEVTGFTRKKGAKLHFVDVTRHFGDVVDVGGLDAVCHLAGESVVGLWSKEKRRKIMDSRVNGTRAVVAGFEECSENDCPSVFISSSAVGYYGDRADEELTENSLPGKGFLTEVVEAWEREAAAAETLDSPVRVVLVRTGIVLGKGGGAGPLLKTVFKTGLAGRLGSGRQWMPWVHVDDVVGIYLKACEEASFSGPVNAVTAAVRNREFTKVAASVAHRPAFIPAPASLLRGVLGGFAEELLSSKLIVSSRARDFGYTFARPDLEGALKDVFS